MEHPRFRFRALWLAAGVLLLAIASVAIRLMRRRAVDVAVDDLGKLLTEVMERPFFEVARISISPLTVIKVTLFLIILGLVSSAVDRALRTRILARTAMDAGQRYALARFAAYAVFVMGLLLGLDSAGWNLNTLAVFGGALGVGIGFGLQNVANNFVAGLILLAERPVKVGDRVEFTDFDGDVMHIGARATWIRTNDNKIIIVPNSQLTQNRMTNWTADDRQVRFSMNVGVAYSSNPEQVRDVLLKVAASHPMVLRNPAPDVVFLGLGDSSLNFSLRVWTESLVQTPEILRSDLYFQIFKVFTEHGIEMPYPQRDLHIRSSDVTWTPQAAEG